MSWLLFPCSLALAFELNGSDWSWQEDPVDVAFTVDVESFPATFGTEDDLLDALQSALDEYNREGGVALHLQQGGRSTRTPEEEIQIVYVPSTGQNAVGFASYMHYGDHLSRSCLIEVYGSNPEGSIDWYVGEDPLGIRAGQTDLRSALLHEIGHCLGLDHSADPSAVMAPAQLTGAAYRHLQADDLDGLVFLFGPLETGYDARWSLSDDDGDGVLDAGELGLLSIGLVNTGNARAPEVQLSLVDLPEGVLADAVFVGDLPLSAPSAVAELQMDASNCAEDAVATIVLEDGRGFTQELGTVAFVCDVAAATDGTDPDDEAVEGPAAAGSSTEKGGCGCAQAPGAVGVGWLFVAGLVARRRRV